MDFTSRYLARIGLPEPPPISREGLEILQRAHLTAVPFENLDVFARRGVRTDLDWSVPKIVERGRGGWCFEVNGAFAALLSGLGFEVVQMPATVLLPPPADEPTHLALVVALEEDYLVDVGFGDSFISPLRLRSGEPQDTASGVFQLLEQSGFRTLYRVGDDGSLAPQYRLEQRAWSLVDFTHASDVLQSDPSLSWLEARFATRLIHGGPDRVTLLENRIRFRRNGVWTEQPVAPEDWSDLLEQWFGLTP